MNSEFKRFFGFSKFFEKQKITNDYNTYKYYKSSTYNSLIIYTLFGMLFTKLSINIYKKREKYKATFVYKRRMIVCI